jgi:KDEL-tailed cysteine endopeptidase
MKPILAILVFCGLALVIVEANSKCKKYTDEEIDAEFEDIAQKSTKKWEQIEKKMEKKGYKKAKKTKDQRKDIFKKKASQINRDNSGGLTFCQGLNFFSSLDEKEIKETYLMSKKATKQKVKRSTPWRQRRSLPTSVDLRDQTGPVENQGQCGSCWAFAGSHTLLGALNKTGDYGNNPSEQQLVDCSYADTQDSCGGGWYTTAWDYLKNNAWAAENDYPYVAKDNTCPAAPSGAAPVVGYTVISGGESAIREAAARQPVAVAFHVPAAFMSYSSGVFNGDCSQTDGGHAVTVVGYGTDPTDGDYWLIKNSWGADWGEGGFVRFKRGTDLCSIESWGPAYPTVAGTPTTAAPPTTTTAAPTTCPVPDSSDCKQLLIASLPVGAPADISGCAPYDSTIPTGDSEAGTEYHCGCSDVGAEYTQTCLVEWWPYTPCTIESTFTCGSAGSWTSSWSFVQYF